MIFEPLRLGAKFLCLLVIVAMSGASSAVAGVAIQYHCAGGLQLADESQPTTLRKILALRSTTNIENIASSRISRLLASRLRLGTNAPSISLIQPLLSDLMGRESLGSFGGASGDAMGFIMALGLDSKRAQSWQDSLSKLLGGGGETFAVQEFHGRRWNLGGANPLWIIPAGDWLLVGRGDDFSNLQTEYLTQIKAQGRPVPPLKQNWLEADLDSARLGGWFRLLKPARISLSVAANGDDLEIRARVLEAEAMTWKPVAWQIPKDSIAGQIISFTVGQDVAALLNLNPALRQLSSNPLTNQFCFWAMDQMPLLNFMVWPVADASNALQRLAIEWPAALNADLKRFNGTELTWNPKSRQLACVNMRMFVPGLEAMQHKDGQFLFLASFPLFTNGPPAPTSLLNQVEGRTNLVYYDWEVTGRRLSEWMLLGKMIANRADGPESDVADAGMEESRWLGDVARLAGNSSSVTKITRVAPNELVVERRAGLGLTAFELNLLADWFCDANSGPIHPPLTKGSAPPFPIPSNH